MKHPTHKLDPRTAIAMRQAHAAGQGVRALAREHGVSLPTVRAVLRYARYRPALSEEQHDRLSLLARRLGRTRDDVLDMVLAKGFQSLGDREFERRQPQVAPCGR